VIHRERLPFAPPFAYGLVFVSVLFAFGAGLLSPRFVEGSPPMPVAYDIVMVLGLAAWVFAGFAFRALEIEAGPQGIVAAFGVLRRRVPRERIESARIAKYGPLTYGGYGWRLTLGKEAWSVFGPRTGVELRVRKKAGGSRTLFVSSREPEAVLRALEIPGGGGGGGAG